MEEIGKIILLQIQRSHMKTIRDSVRIYDPDPLQSVKHLLLTQQGIIGYVDEHSSILDVHHLYHPKSRNRDQTNGISFGITSHYQDMREKFGNHIVDGVGGENIIIQTKGSIPYDRLGNWIAIKSHKTEELTYLNNIMAASPCVEFSQFAAGRNLSPAEEKDALQFLDNGKRGYYATLDQFHKESKIELGDYVYTFDVT